MRATHILFAAALPSLSQALLLTDKSYTPCSTASQVESVNITPCDKEPCTFTKGTSVHVIMAGTSQQEVDAVDLKMEAQLGQWVPIVNEGVCGTSLECPIQTSREWTLDYVYTVDDRLPDGDDLLTRWKLVGNYGADEIACVEIQLNIA